MQELKFDPISTAVPRVDWRENRGFLLLIKKNFHSFGWKLFEKHFKKSPKMAEQEEKIPTIAEDIVVTKYKMAAEIVNRKLGL